LRHKGYEVLEAINVEQTLECARHHSPDVILLDVMMPGTSGWEVAKELRADEQLLGIGIVILTAMGERVSHMTAAVYGADACVDKPVDFDDLEKQIKKILDSRTK
jgi:DNA-binding response OmpR family regulator